MFQLFLNLWECDILSNVTTVNVAINQRHFENTQVFPCHSCFNILCIISSSCYYCLEFEWFRICYVIIWIIFVVCHTLPDVFAYLSMVDYIILYIDIPTSRYLTLSVGILFISLMQSTNGAKFLNVSSLFLLSAFLTFACASFPVIVKVLFSSVFASLHSQMLEFSIVVLKLIILVLTICVACSMGIMIYLNPVIFSEFWWLTFCFVEQIYDFLIHHSRCMYLWLW